MFKKIKKYLFLKIRKLLKLESIEKYDSGANKEEELYAFLEANKEHFQYLFSYKNNKKKPFHNFLHSQMIDLGGNGNLTLVDSVKKTKDTRPNPFKGVYKYKKGENISPELKKAIYDLNEAYAKEWAGMDIKELRKLVDSNK